MKFWYTIPNLTLKELLKNINKDWRVENLGPCLATELAWKVKCHYDEMDIELFEEYEKYLFKKLNGKWNIVSCACHCNKCNHAWVELKDGVEIMYGCIGCNPLPFEKMT